MLYPGCTHQNKVNQVFSIKSIKIFKDYESDNANVDDIERFEYEVNKLAYENLIDMVEISQQNI